MEWGYRLKRLREQRGWSQTTLAGLSDLDQTTIAKLESGKREFSLGIIKKLASGFEWGVSELIVMLEGQKHNNHDEVMEGLYQNYIRFRAVVMEYYSLTNSIIANQNKLIEGSDLVRQADWEFYQKNKVDIDKIDSESDNGSRSSTEKMRGGTSLMPKSLPLNQFLNKRLFAILPVYKI